MVFAIEKQNARRWTDEITRKYAVNDSEDLLLFLGSSGPAGQFVQILIKDNVDARTRFAKNNDETWRCDLLYLARPLRLAAHSYPPRLPLTKLLSNGDMSWLPAINASWFVEASQAERRDWSVAADKRRKGQAKTVLRIGKGFRLYNRDVVVSRFASILSRSTEVFFFLFFIKSCISIARKLANHEESEIFRISDSFPHFRALREFLAWKLFKRHRSLKRRLKEDPSERSLGRLFDLFPRLFDIRAMWTELLELFKQRLSRKTLSPVVSSRSESISKICVSIPTRL